MNYGDILSRVQKSFSEILRVPEERIVPEARLIEDLDVDSLFITQLAMGLEEEFDIEVSDTDTPLLTTVASVVDYVTQKLETK